jgi:hypothetical protein
VLDRNLNERELHACVEGVFAGFVALVVLDGVI